MTKLFVTLKLRSYLVRLLIPLLNNSSPEKFELTFFPQPLLLKDCDPNHHKDSKPVTLEGYKVSGLHDVKGAEASIDGWQDQPGGIEVLESVYEAPSFAKVVLDSCESMILIRLPVHEIESQHLTDRSILELVLYIRNFIQLMDLESAIYGNHLFPYKVRNICHIRDYRVNDRIDIL